MSHKIKNCFKNYDSHLGFDDLCDHKATLSLLQINRTHDSFKSAGDLI